MSEEDWEVLCQYSVENFFRERFELSKDNPSDIRNYAVIYSEARSGFEVSLQNNNGLNKLEDNKYEKSGANYSGLIQLLIDLEEKDNNEYLKYAKFNPNCTYEEYMRKNSSVARFKRAFNGRFQDISYMVCDWYCKK